MENAFRQANMKAAKLTVSQVLEIRKLYAEGWTQGALCKQFSVGVNQIGRIVRGESWKNLPQTLMNQQELMKSAARMMELQEAVQRGDIGPDQPPIEAPVSSGLDRLETEADRIAREQFGAFGGVEKALDELKGGEGVPKSPLDE